MFCISKCTDRCGCALFNTDDATAAAVNAAVAFDCVAFELDKCAFGRRGSTRWRRGSLTVLLLIVDDSGSCGGENGEAFAFNAKFDSDSDGYSSLMRKMRRRRGSSVFSCVGILLRSSL